MGHVYRARDARLKREVAIKVLPAEFSTDPDRLARFQREAEILATLHHSNIATVYGVEEFEGSRALVMEFVDGATLAERLGSGPFQVTDVGEIARQLADALDAAHERGIVHRDLKPANIKVTRDGTVKVLDFGLAKDVTPLAQARGNVPDAAATEAATITTPAMTSPGFLLGTAAYMSPEQARGKPVDKRADIWAYGCVLFELLTGRRTFDGETVTDVLAAVVGREPDWSGLPPDTPAALRTIIRRCLRKDPKSRSRDMGDIRTMLEDATGVDVTAPPTSASHGASGRSWKPWAVTISSMVLGALAVGALAFMRQSPPPARATRFVVLPPDGGAFNATYLHQAISPDGSRLAFLAYAGPGPSMVWVRVLDDVTPHSLAGTEGASTLFWSPDSTAIAFFTDGFLKRVGVNGGAVRNIANMPSSRLQLLTSAGPSGSWSSKGTIVFGPADDGRLFQVDARGGTPTPVSALSEPKGDKFHLLPEFLPDGQHFLYISRPGGDIWSVQLMAAGHATCSTLTAKLSTWLGSFFMCVATHSIGKGSDQTPWTFSPSRQS